VGLAVVGAGAVGGVALAAPQKASRPALDGMTGSVTYAATPATVWAMTQDANSLCSMIPACASATAVPGKPGTFIMTINDDLRIAGIDAIGAIPVTVTVADRVPGESVGVKISIDEKLGTFTSDAVLTMASDGAGSTKTVYRTTSASGTGVLGRLAMSQMGSALQGQMRESAAQYQTQVSEQMPTALKVTTTRGRSGSVIVTGTISTTPPAGFTPSKASGRMTVLVAGKVACRARIVGSAGRCTAKRGTKPSTMLVAASGSFENGVSFTLGSRTRVAGAGRSTLRADDAFCLQCSASR
jgi:carbon monoxide dehydrogenase subunit G